MQWLRLGVMWVLACVSINLWAQTNPSQVLVSIHPIALLVKSAWPEVDVSTLVPPNQSPHDFALKPSHRQIIAQAEHVVWLGEDMEPYLAKVLGGHGSVTDLSDLFAKADVNAQAHDDHADEHEDHAMHEEHDAHAGHDHGNVDPHIWLNPAAVPSILHKVQLLLGLPEPKAFLSSYGQWQQQARSALTHQDTGFVSFHDAFHYWVTYFHLNQAATLAINPEQPVGTRHLLEVRRLLESGKVACLFVEPQFKASIVDKLQQGTDVPVVKIDPLASNFKIESAGFLEFYAYLQRQFQQCYLPN